MNKVDKKLPKHNLTKILKTFLAPYKFRVLAVVILQCVQSLLNLFIPTLNANIISNGVVNADVPYIKRMGIWMIVVSLLQVIFTVVSIFLSAQTSLGLGKDIRNALFDKVGDFSGREISKFGVPSLITRTTNDVQQIQMIVFMFFTLIVTAPITMVAGIVLSLKHDPNMSVILLISIPVMGLFIGTLAHIALPIFKKVQTTIDKVNRILREQLTGIRVIRAFVRDPYEHRRFDKINEKLRGYNTKIYRLFSSMFPVVMFIVNMTNICVFYLGGHQIDNGKMSIGSLSAVSTYILQILIAITIATMLLIMLPRAQVSARRIRAVLTTISTISINDKVNQGEAKLDNNISKYDEGIEMKDVIYRYSGAEKPVLSDISFKVPIGTTTAIIGSTGSGKTTLVNLVARIFDATKGSVKVLGRNVKGIELEDLWGHIGIATQKSILFSGTIRSNMQFGKEDATDKEIWEALDIACASEFIKRLPDGLDSHVAQGGTNFSGGQKQRLSIARVVIRKPAICLFDDTFSALDFSVDAKVRHNLKKVTQNASVIIVAQRIGTILNADQIIVLDDGKIVGCGKHRELLDSCKVYKEIVKSQLSEEEVNSFYE